MKLLKMLPLLLLLSCGAFRINADIGMSEAEFKKRNTGYSLSEMGEGYSIYRIMTTSGGQRFVYFEDGKLVRMDEGEMRPNVRIRVE